MFKKPRSLGIRVWHWLNSALIFGLLATVLMRDTVLSPRVIAGVIRDKLAVGGAEVSADQARGAAKALTERLWVWHVYLGYGLAALVALRLVVLVAEARRARAATAAQPTLHYRLVKALHASFYVALVVMTVTGLMLAFKAALGLPMQTVHAVHENAMWWVIGFVALHIGGVVRAEQGEDAGIVSEMLHGGAAGPSPPAS